MLFGYAQKGWYNNHYCENRTGTYKCTFTVYKYVNPVSSAKVGKLTIKGTAFKKNAIYNLRYSKYKNKSIAFKFNLKKGWKLRRGISYARSNWGVAKMSPNGSKIKVAGGSGFLAVALAENIKTGREKEYTYISNKLITFNVWH